MLEKRSETSASTPLNSAAWTAAAIAIVAIAALIPVALSPRYYFNDDTQIGAFGIWYRLGELLRSGGVPFIEPSTWAAGNYWVEGQWGLLNPIVLAIGWFARTSANAIVFTSVVKVLFLSLCAVGVRGLARTYGASQVLSFLAATAVPLAGFTFYFDATTWVTGLFVFTFLAWFWWAIRVVLSRGGMWPMLGAFGAGYLVVTVGYVHGTIALIAVLGISLVDALLARTERRRILTVVLIGVALGMMTIAVFAPAMLSSDVTVRSSTGVSNDGFLVADLSGLASSPISTALPQVSGWWGATAIVPMLYITWALPAVSYIDLRRYREYAREFVGIGIFIVFMTLFICGPSNAGPLRFPVRMMPYLVLAVIVTLVALLSRASRITTPRMVAFAALTGCSAYFALAQVPGRRFPVAESALVCLVGGIALVLVIRSSRRSLWWGAVAMIGVLAVTTSWVQHRASPTSALADYGLPGDTALYQDLLAEEEGDSFIAGEPTRAPSADIWKETALGNQWYLVPKPVHNVYSPVGYRAYIERFCMSNRGETCADSLEALLDNEPVTGLPRADLMGVSTIQLVRSAFPDGVPTPPEGWRVAIDRPMTQTWVRQVPVSGAGGVTWTSEGLRVTETSVSNTRTVVTVDEVGPEGGRLVLSRLAWPGYTVQGGAVSEPIDDYLLTVDIPPGATDSTVVIEFRPTGWPLVCAALALAALILVALVFLTRQWAAQDKSLAMQPRQ